MGTASQRSRRMRLAMPLALVCLVWPGATLAYDPSRAANYADIWWNDFNDTVYGVLRNDCTNFVSQALHAGGYPMHRKYVESSNA